MAGCREPITMASAEAIRPNALCRPTSSADDPEASVHTRQPATARQRTSAASTGAGKPMSTMHGRLAKFGAGSKP
eukprot:scaffold266934_cov35-Tisochrysis_lutea.AAC.1